MDALEMIKGARIQLIPLFSSPFQVFYMKPHYILFIHLIFNDMIQLTTTICLLILSYIFYKINASLCCLMITFAILTTLNTPFNLAIMAVECYIAVCLPLRHANLCTIKRTYILIVSIWALSVVSTLPDVFIILATEPFRLFFSNIFCERDNLFRHPLQIKKRDFLYILYMTINWLILFYTYIRIFLAAREAKAAKKSGGETLKARNTILLHGFQLLLCMLTYVAHEIKSALIQWFPKNSLNVAFVVFVMSQILPRCISSLVYGLRDKTLRQYLIKYLLWWREKAFNNKL